MQRCPYDQPQRRPRARAGGRCPGGRPGERSSPPRVAGVPWHGITAVPFSAAVPGYSRVAISKGAEQPGRAGGSSVPLPMLAITFSADVLDTAWRLCRCTAGGRSWERTVPQRVMPMAHQMKEGP